MVLRTFPVLALTVVIFGCASGSGRDATTPIGYTPWDEAAHETDTTPASQPAAENVSLHSPTPAIDLPAPVKPPPPPEDEDVAAADESVEEEGAGDTGAPSGSAAQNAGADEQDAPRTAALATDTAGPASANGGQVDVDHQDDIDDQDDEDADQPSNGTAAHKAVSSGAQAPRRAHH